MVLATAIFALAISAPPVTQAVPFFLGLGSHHRKVTTNSKVAQRYFDQGLDFLMGFNHDEAIRAFTAASNADPNCAMAWWGIATANGPHINNPMVDEDHAKAAWAALTKARALRGRATPVERALIDAAGSRFANPQPKDRSGLDKAYADAMRGVWKKFSSDADVGAMFGESMMDLRPWDLWMHDGTPQPGTMEVVWTLRTVLSLDKNHPLGLHLYIHSVEASPHPEWAVDAANRLRHLQPGLGHMVHMPSHIDVRTGEWLEAIRANQRAMNADAAYKKVNPNQGFYRIYMAHNHHMLAFAAMMRGQYELASSTMDSAIGIFPEEVLQMLAPIADGFMAMPMEVRVRFGKWDEVLATPEFPEVFPISRTLRHGARAVAYAAKGMVPEARLEQSLFYAAKKNVPKDATFGNNTAADLLAVAGHLMNGEIQVADGRMDEAFITLRNGVRAEDQLRYDEPPDWIQPVRHTYGAVLLKAGRNKDAEDVYRVDLRKLPHNVWALYGLSQALAAQGKTAEAAKFKSQFAKASMDADTKIDSSCLCVKH